MAGGFPAFRAQSHPSLWEDWQGLVRPTWLKEHVANLRARYEVSLGWCTDRYRS